MREVQIEGVPVEFPYEPYQCQLAYMQKVVDACRLGVNAALESPTGTGKTLSLLCATLAWQRQRKLAAMSDAVTEGNFEGISGAPKIFYTSRTHSQLSQVVRELNKTVYKKTNMCLLGSRDQLCLHDDVQKESNNNLKNQKCRALVAKRQCSFHNGYESRGETHKCHYETGQALDIEDFVSIGRKTKMCPFYKSREALEAADLILLPYNYIFDERARKANKIELRGHIVIFDEGHNLEKMCEESASVTLKSRDVAACLKETRKALEDSMADEENYRTTMDKTDAQFGSMGQQAASDAAPKILLNKHDVGHLILLLQQLEEEMDKVTVNESQLLSNAHPGAFLIDLLQRAGFTYERKADVVALVDQVTQYLANKGASAIFDSPNLGADLQKFANFISVVFGSTNQNASQPANHKAANSFTVYICRDEEQKRGGWGKMDAFTTAGGPAGVAINYWCFSAGVGMRAIQALGVRSIILTSGTLSPLNLVVKELGIAFALTLENDHVIQPSQVWIGIVSKGPDKCPLVSNFANRNNPAYMNSLACTLINLCRIVPQGMLVFFHSYSQMNAAVGHWKACDLWQRMNQRKRVFVEARSKLEFADMLREFNDAILANGSNGAVLMAVCRGKASEGLDFADYQARAIVLAGIPYPPMMDARVQLKKRHLAADAESLSPDDWYMLEAVRASNQAMGRVIRHQKDYGAVILADARFARWGSESLPSWLRGACRPFDSFGDVQRLLVDFYRLNNGAASSAAAAAVGRSSSASSAFVAPRSSTLTPTRTPSAAAAADDRRRLFRLLNGGDPTVQKCMTDGAVGSLPSPSLFVGSLQARQCCDNDHTTSTQICAQTKNNTALAILEGEAGASVKRSHEPGGCYQCCPATASTAASAAAEPGAARKRIKLKANDEAAAQKGAVSVRLTPVQFRDLAERLLSKEKVDDLFKVATKYKESEDLAQLHEGLARVLLPEHDNLYRGFSSFVRPRQKTQFAQFCREKFGSS